MVLSLQLILFPVAASANSTVGYAKAVSSMALSSVGSVIITACPNGMRFPSIAIFNGAAIAMVAGDIILAKSYTDYQKKKRSELKLKEEEMKDENGNVQKEILEERLAMEKQELEHIKKRELLHYALGSAMVVGATFAVLEAYTDWIGVNVVVCNPVSGEVAGISVSNAILLAWSAASGMGGGTSGAGSWFGYLQMGLSLFTGIYSKLTSAAMSYGSSRAIFMGANSALLFWVAADLSGRKKDVNENVKKLEDLKVKLAKSDTKDGLATGETPDTDYKKDIPKMNIKALATVAESKSCFSMKGSPSFGSGACSSAVKLNPITYPGGINLPLFQNVAASTVAAANDLSAGNWEGAEVSLADINSKAAQIRKLADEVEKKVNDKLKAEGKPTIDFKAEIAKKVAAIQQDLDNAVAGAGSSLAPAPQSTLGKDVEEKKEDGAASSSAAAASEVPMPSIDLGGFSSTSVEDPAPATPTKSIDESLNDYEVAENDISTKTDVSIFKQVSNRYILNYKNFFNEKKTLTPEAPAKPVPASP